MFKSLSGRNCVREVSGLDQETGCTVNNNLTFDLAFMPRYFFCLGMYKKQIQEEEKSIAGLNRRIRELEIQVDHQRKNMGGYVHLFVCMER